MGLSPSQAPFSFAAASNIVPVVLSEIALAMAHYPLVFIMEQAAASPALVALVGNGDGKNQFVSDTGAWREQTYIPAWVRRYPFILVNQDAESPNAALAFDPTSELLSDSHAVKLVHEGQATEALNGILAFQREMASALQVTAAAAKALHEAGVLEASGLRFAPADSSAEAKTVAGFMVVNEKTQPSQRFGPGLRAAVFHEEPAKLNPPSLTACAPSRPAAAHEPDHQPPSAAKAPAPSFGLVGCA
jgi:hypothetical protein